MSAAGRRTRVRAILAALGSALLLFALAAPTWFAVEVPGILDDRVAVSVTGTAAVPALGGVALVLLAAGGALGIAGAAGRRVVGVLCVLGGAVAGWLTLESLGAPGSALRGPVAEATGVGAVAGDPTTAPWPYLALAVALLVILQGCWHALGIGEWPAPGTRHARRGPGDRAAGEPPEEDDPTRDWDALSDGDDPTLPGRIP